MHMVVRRLNQALVSRLRRIVKREQTRDSTLIRADYHVLGGMKNIDHRKGDSKSVSTDNWGFRVRQMNVKRNFPNTGLVIKRMDGGQSAQNVLREVNQRVRKIALLKPKLFTVRPTIAYSLGEDLAAMAYTNFPSIYEMAGAHFNWRRDETPRGKKFLAKLQKRFRVTEEQFVQAAQELGKMAGEVELRNWGSNFICAGFQKGKFVFVRLMDLR